MRRTAPHCRISIGWCSRSFPDQNAELLRLQARAIDTTQDALRPEDFVARVARSSRALLKMVNWAWHSTSMRSGSA
jgi:hypothetical protein